MQGHRILTIALLVGIVSQLRHRVWQGNDIGTGQGGGRIKAIVKARCGGNDLEDGTRRQRFCTGVVDQRLSLLLLQIGPNILGGITHQIIGVVAGVGGHSQDLAGRRLNGNRRALVSRAHELIVGRLLERRIDGDLYVGALLRFIGQCVEPILLHQGVISAIEDVILGGL